MLYPHLEAGLTKRGWRVWQYWTLFPESDNGNSMEPLLQPTRVYLLNIIMSMSLMSVISLLTRIWESWGNYKTKTKQRNEQQPTIPETNIEKRKKRINHNTQLIIKKQKPKNQKPKPTSNNTLTENKNKHPHKSKNKKKQ